MKRLAIIILIAASLLSAGCAAHCRDFSEQDYDQLQLGIIVSAKKIKGVFNGNMPIDMDKELFLKTIKNRIPEDGYDLIASTHIEITSYGTYYFLKLYDKDSNKLILFDYSCTHKVDGPVWAKPINYDLDNLEQYNSCKD